jgi:molybdenum cofactor cytidylyltransferase
MLFPKDVRIPALLMAAGMSTRMGRNKLLLPFNGHTVVAETCDRLLQSHVSKIIVVLGNDQDKVFNELKDKRVVFVINPNYDLGMSTSLRSGVSYLPDDTKFFMVALGDQPLVSVSAYNALIGATCYTSHKIFIPTYGRERGNPTILSAEFIPEIMDTTGDIGGRELVRRHPETVQEVPVINEGVIINMNTPEEYAFRVAEFEKNKHDA